MSGAGPSTPSDPDGMTLRIKLMDNSEHHVTCSTQVGPLLWRLDLSLVAVQLPAARLNSVCWVNIAANKFH